LARGSPRKSRGWRWRSQGQKVARDREALAALAARSQAMFECAEAFAAALARDLERCAAIQAVIPRKIALPTV